MDNEIINGKKVEELSKEEIELLQSLANDDDQKYTETLLPKEYFDKFKSRVNLDITDKKDKPTINNPFKFPTSSIRENDTKVYVTESDDIQKSELGLPHVDLSAYGTCKSASIHYDSDLIVNVNTDIAAFEIEIDLPTVMRRLQLERHLTNDDMIDGINTFLHNIKSDYEIRKKEKGE